ncbi:MAG: GGDEF domain-containing protein [Acinetobacter sp.]|jgi:diguanylate cyclase (GGDEF)-like protein|nr:MAG: GGDEF domain-containing protein [Acinetobacter sp.]
MHNFEQLLTTSVLARRFIILVVIAILGWIDLATGYEYSFSVFYLLPVSMAAWYDHYKAAILTIMVCGTTWLIADFNAGHHYSNKIIPFWNGLVRMGFFSIVAFLLFKIRRNWNEMKKMAMKDQLTSLDNSRAFEIEYRILRKISFRKDLSFAVAIVDLDGFKAVNDTFGHSKGDEVLVRFAQLLKQANRNTDVVARLGGDEFAMILLDVNEHTVQDYETRLRQLFQSSGLKQSYGVDFSMGIMILNELPKNMEQATQLADRLMYQSKAQGKSQTTIQTHQVN